MEELEFDRYEPDWGSNCIVCGQSPCVTMVDKDSNYLDGTGMCGPCTFGTAKALDWDWWNADDPTR